MDYDNDMKGVLFKNEKRERESQPNYKGTCEINGTEYWMSAWVNKSKKGMMYMSLSFQEKDASSAAAGCASDAGSNAGSDDVIDDDIPF